MKNLTWYDKLTEWINGKPLSYPKSISNKDGFVYHSNCCNKGRIYKTVLYY